MKKCSPDISLDYRITPKTQNFDQQLSQKCDPNFHFETTKNQQNAPPGGRGGAGKIFFSPKTLKIIPKYAVCNINTIRV